MMEHLHYILLILLSIYFFVSIAVFVVLYVSKSKIAKIAEENIRDAYNSIPRLTVAERLSYTNDLFIFIDSLIELEIINKKRFSILLNQPDKNLDVDEIITEVSSHVFKSISPDVFTNNDSMVTPTYLMEYIQKKTFLVYITYINKTVADQL